MDSSVQFFNSRHKKSRPLKNRETASTYNYIYTNNYFK